MALLPLCDNSVYAIDIRAMYLWMQESGDGNDGGNRIPNIRYDNHVTTTNAYICALLTLCVW